MNFHPQWNWTVLCLTVILLLACSSRATTDNGHTGDVDAGDVPDSQNQLKDAEDVVTKDTWDQPDRNIGPLDSLDCQSLAGGTHCPCETNEDCFSGFCVLHMGEQVCTDTCVEECPDGWTCSQASGVDTVFICISRFPVLCLPCSSSADCQGGTGKCIVQNTDGTPGPNGAFCGGNCSEKQPCSIGYDCQNVNSTEETEGLQCVPSKGECGCSQYASAKSLMTACTVSNESGICQGWRVCSTDGLSACDGNTPETEKCDGQDNNCNGSIDEGNLCNDDNQCTQDECSETGQCVFFPNDELSCDDDDPCTVEEHCAYGQCLSNSVDCNDDDVCTDDSCDKDSGCIFTNNTGPCQDDDDACTEDICDSGECIHVTGNDGAFCTDDDPCTKDEFCLDGECIPGNYELECIGTCGDAECGYTEDADTCPEDCGPCGDGICGHHEMGKDGGNCPQDCLPACGDGKCVGGESFEWCLIDCSGCGDTFCGLEESPESCPGDCPSACGNDVCEPGEGPFICPADCLPPCGDTLCQKGENPWNCPVDCTVCGDTVCGSDEDAENCPQDCMTACGNALCEGGENPENCAVDCGPCGDGTCGFMESPLTCQLDCKWGECGDGQCDGAIGETEEECPQDCLDDIDNDGVPDLIDNCPMASNPDQEDFDDDDMGDLCDLDDDDDGDNDVSDCAPLDDLTYHDAPEICDGTDNNCDSETDNEVNCNDDIACTIDSCEGVGGCLNKATDLLCFDDNVCTQDVCSPETGCSNPNVLSGTSCNGPGNWTCTAGECTCETACEGKECGVDGCGGTCGECPPIHVCLANGACLCVPSCDGKDCGTDGCSGSCGNCGQYQECSEVGVCVCQQDSSECDEFCCQPGQVCHNLACCTPQCEDKVCGSDSCGSQCGTCNLNLNCINGQCLCDDGNQTDWDGCNDGQVVEMQVHTFSGGCQGHPAITVLTDGKIVVTWHGKGATAEKGIWGRMFLVDGPPAGPVFHVNESAEDLQEAPAIAALSNGGFVIAWQEGGDDGTSADGSERGVYARLFNNSGQPSGNRFPVNSYTANDQKSADVAALNNGAFVVVWQSGENWDDGPDGSRGGIVFQLFGASGEKTGDEQIANSETDLDQMDPAVASLSDGSFVITWSSDEQDGSGLGIFGQRFDGSGNKDGLEFQINETTQHHQSSSDIAVFEDGEFAVVWRSIINPSPNIQRIYGRLYTSDGDAADSQFVIGPSVNGDINQAPAVAASEGDEWLVTWHGDSASLFGDNSDHGVLVQKYSGSEPLGETILSHTYMTGSQNYADAAYLPDGRIAVVWISYWQDGDCGGIYLQYLSADGEKIYPGPCTPQCDGKECGENGCGGFCGSCDDDVECTEDSCMDGSCTHSISQMYCLIDEVCVSSGTVNPLSSCDYCAPLSSPESWSTREDGYICGADMVCFQGSCCDVGANCEGKDCGDDGCGGICGECDPGQYCIKATCPPPGQQCDDGNEQIWDGCTNGEVTEFAVEIQASPGNVSAGTLSNKGFAIVYRAKSGGKPGDYNIAGRIFDSSGKNIKTLIPVNNETDGSQGGPGVVALEDKFFVFWEDSNEGSLGIFARPYDNSGNSLGSQFHVNSDSSGNGPPDATALESGNFIITWWISSSQNSDILGRWFDSDGAPASNSFYVIQKSQEKDAMPSVAPIANANVAIAWIRLNKTTGRGLAIYSRRFDIEGIPLEEPVLIDAFDQVNEPEAVSLPDGGYVVAWSRGSTQDIDLFGQKFTNDGSKSGGQFLINTTTDFNQGGITMAPQPNGFVAFWGSTQVDNGRVYGQLFNSNTGKVGGEFLAHVYIANKQVGPSVSSFSDGSFIVAWISWNQEGILQSAYAQRFDASGQKMYH